MCEYKKDDTHSALSSFCLADVLKTEREETPHRMIGYHKMYDSLHLLIDYSIDQCDKMKREKTCCVSASFTPSSNLNSFCKSHMPFQVFSSSGICVLSVMQC